MIKNIHDKLEKFQQITSINSKNWKMTLAKELIDEINIRLGMAEEWVSNLEERSERAYSHAWKSWKVHKQYVEHYLA
jgi:hypothetical protein